MHQGLVPNRYARCAACGRDAAFDIQTGFCTVVNCSQARLRALPTADFFGDDAYRTGRVRIDRALSRIDEAVHAVHAARRTANLLRQSGEADALTFPERRAEARFLSQRGAFWLAYSLALIGAGVVVAVLIGGV